MIENLVSTIIPVFNRGPMLREAVDSVLGQSHPNLEVVIVDDGSTDDSLAVAQALIAQWPNVIKLARQTNSGPGAARNLGLRLATGEFVQFLDSDDLLEPRKFELQVRALREHPEAGVAYGLTRRIDMTTGETRAWARTAERIERIFPDFLPRRGWDTNSPLWRRSVCDAIGAWSNLRCLEDWEHDLRAGILGIRPVQVCEHVATVRDHAGNRASGMGGGYTPAAARDVFQAHRGIWLLMQGAGLDDWSYLEGFSRKFFWVARLCGGLGLDAEADEALSISRTMTANRGTPLSVRFLLAARRVLGWSRAERLARAAGRTLRGAASKAHV